MRIIGIEDSALLTIEGTWSVYRGNQNQPWTTDVQDIRTSTAINTADNPEIIRAANWRRRIGGAKGNGIITGTGGDIPGKHGIGCTLQIEDVIAITTVQITGKRRSQGIGTVLVKYLSKWLKKEKYLGIKVYTEEVDEKNIRLQGFYEKLGFILQDKETNGNLIMILWF